MTDNIILIIAAILVIPAAGVTATLINVAWIRLQNWRGV